MLLLNSKSTKATTQALNIPFVVNVHSASSILAGLTTALALIITAISGIVVNVHTRQTGRSLDSHSRHILDIHLLTLCRYRSNLLAPFALAGVSAISPTIVTACAQLERRLHRILPLDVRPPALVVELRVTCLGASHIPPVPHVHEVLRVMRLARAEGVAIVETAPSGA